MNNDKLRAYVKAEVEEWFTDITDREPEPEEIERVTYTVTKDAAELISTSICNICS